MISLMAWLSEDISKGYELCSVSQGVRNIYRYMEVASIVTLTLFWSLSIESKVIMLYLSVVSLLVTQMSLNFVSVIELNVLSSAASILSVTSLTAYPKSMPLSMYAFWITWLRCILTNTAIAFFFEEDFVLQVTLMSTSL